MAWNRKEMIRPGIRTPWCPSWSLMINYAAILLICDSLTLLIKLHVWTRPVVCKPGSIGFMDSPFRHSSFATIRKGFLPLLPFCF